MINRPATSLQIEFAYRSADFRAAYGLDVRSAGRWRGILSSTLVTAGMGWVLLVVLQHQGGGHDDPALPYIAFSAAAVAMFLAGAACRKQH